MRKILGYLLCFLFITVSAQQSIAYPSLSEASKSENFASDDRVASENIFDKASGRSLLSLSLDELLEVKIVTASKIEESLSKTSSSITVITDTEIHQMGARSVIDVLRNVPGVSITRGRRGSYIVGMRGVQTVMSSRILFLLDGHALNDAINGSAHAAFIDNLPIDFVKRIEVVRGPGSALYGTNAFLGVINIITKSKDDIQNCLVSYNVELEEDNLVGHRYNVFWAHELSENAGLVIDANLKDFDGAEMWVEADALGRSGYADTRYEQFDILSKLEIGKFTVLGRFSNMDIGDYVGVGQVLSNEQSNHSFKFAYIKAGYEKKLGLNFEIKSSIYYDHRRSANEFVIFSAGSIPSPHPLNAWNDTGYIGGPHAKQTLIGGEIEAICKKYQDHIFMAGITARYEEAYDVEAHNNYNPAPLPEVQNVSDVHNWMANTNRSIIALYLQDIWQIKKNVRLTFGGRYDYYNDFGSTVNPRTQMTWNIVNWCDIKLGYGTAFRAPDFRAQYLKNNPVAEGNPNLDAENVSTYEGGIGLKLQNWGNLNIIFFHNELRDLIETSQTEKILENIGEVTVDGIEIEAHFQPLEILNIRTSYTVLESKFENGEDFYNIPQHNASLVSNLNLNKYLNYNLNVYWQGESPRSSIDSREALNSYSLVNTSLLLHDFWRNLELQLTVFNLLDDNSFRYPSEPNTIPGDYPTARRSFVIGLKYNF